MKQEIKILEQYACIDCDQFEIKITWQNKTKLTPGSISNEEQMPSSGQRKKSGRLIRKPGKQ